MSKFNCAEKEMITESLIDFLTKEDSCLDDNEVTDCVDLLEELRAKYKKAEVIENAYNLIVELQNAAVDKNFKELVEILLSTEVQEWLDTALKYEP